MLGIFTRHPRSMGETYIGHLIAASIFGTRLVLGGMACLIHAVFPFLFKDTGSNAIYRMVHTFINRSPEAEERMKCLSDALNKKIKEN